MTTGDFESDFSRLQDIADIAFEQSRAFREYCERADTEADALAATEAAAAWDALTPAEKASLPTTDAF